MVRSGHPDSKCNPIVPRFHPRCHIYHNEFKRRSGGIIDRVVFTDLFTVVPWDIFVVSIIRRYNGV